MTRLLRIPIPRLVDRGLATQDLTTDARVRVSREEITLIFQQDLYPVGGRCVA